MAWTSGPRLETLAQTIVTKTRQRTRGHIGISYVSDGWKPYAETIKATYREREPPGIRPGWDILRPTAGIRLTQAVKHRKGRRLARVEVRATIGEAAELPSARSSGPVRPVRGALVQVRAGAERAIVMYQ